MKAKKLIALALMASMALVALAGCGETQKAADDTAETAAAPGEDAGFTEIPIGDDQEVGPLNVAAVYFQPVDMEGGTTKISAEDFDIHIEADISALENDLGYGVGDWVPYLTVDYAVVAEDGTAAAEGTFMEMNASDGPHYGANIKLPDAGTYSFQLKIHSPEENGFLLHTDAETGVTGKFWDEPLEVSFDDWEYIPQEW